MRATSAEDEPAHRRRACRDGERPEADADRSERHDEDLPSPRTIGRGADQPQSPDGFIFRRSNGPVRPSGPPGTPVLLVGANRASDTPGLVVHESNGLLVEPGNASALAAALARLTDPAEVARLARNARPPRTFADQLEELRGIYRAANRTGPASVDRVTIATCTGLFTGS